MPLYAGPSGRVRPRSVVIGNGVDPERFRPPTADERAAARDRLGLSEDDRAVLFVGHEFDRKGLPQLVAAVASLPSTTHLVVVGGTPDLVAGIQRTAAAELMGGRLHLVGPVADPRSIFHACDVFVLASAYEAYPLVVLEAMASGLPVVTTRVGPAAELIQEGVNGRLVQRTPASIRRGIEVVLSGQPQAARSAARSTALEHTWDVVAARYLALFEELR